ncbi:MAG: alpha/beta hydrolase [Cyclobacteriaceae bacterium]|nr:alpha/beta hydrolase [Cyclobacteriaceae bacterium]
MNTRIIVSLLAVLIPLHTLSQSWKEIAVKDSTSQRTLHGTLLIPETRGKIPVALIIAGSGPTDRNGNSAAMKSDYLKMLAEGLAANGIASLRYDKRSIGQSTVAVKSEETMVFEDFINDAGSWIVQLKKDNRFSKVIVLGHSEGSLLGMIASREFNADGYVSLAGAGRPIDQVLREQLAANKNNPEELIKNANEILDTLKLGRRPKLINLYLLALFRPSIQPFLISWMKYDPALEIKKLTLPLMIVQGTTDIQASMVDAELLHRAVPKARYLVVEGMNHVFRDAPIDRSENIKAYMDATRPLSATLVPSLVEFIREVK